MTRPGWRNLYAWALSAFFVVGGSVNLFPPEAVIADYRRWGYPDGFHVVTGLLELTAALLIAFPGTRLAGSALAAVLMVAAAGTVSLHGEYSHAVIPLAVLALVGLNAWLSGLRAT
ncbi:DoxX family protein [Jiella avicenniae]|uniref:DoxX family protein n=1 Tax=Jiella avicenniae TaxID=2907202 RepID=A0A9X1P5D6_9HYPH|nr:DoxX family protein [Jiella avicenniae]MCE7029598.1 DoxX family protein [Jiella avicenniae]